ncbi:MAG TPA: hypothetical protein VJV04_00345 [Nitrospiraceae bacterium]|nr:hypothetical protein [Nitrospiraceae bacterium]
MKYYDAGLLNQTRKILWLAGFLPLTLSLTMFAPGEMSHATGFSSPKECESFAEEAHLNCLYRYIERQRQNTAAVESDKNPRDGMLEQIPAKQPQVDQLTPIADEGGGQSAGAELPQAAAAPARSPDAIMPGVGSPMECRAYSGAAHLNCLYAYIEIQHSKSGKVEEELNAQKQMLGQLREQMDRQASASQDLQRRLAERDGAASVYLAPPTYPGLGYPGFGYPGFGYPRYGYSAPGLSLYLGPPGYYWGGPFYGPRFFGHRFGHHHR